MDNTYYVLSTGWMHSHKSQITVCMNFHVKSSPRPSIWPRRV